MEPLVEWGHASLETSVNQASLPHAIVVLNTVDVEESAEMWDTEHATDWFLRSVRSSIHRVPYLNDLAQLWIRRGKPISTTYDLIKCYYSSLNVIQVPREGRTTLMVLHLHRIRQLISL